MSDTSSNYQPGDIANGHILSNNGQWLPVGGPTPPVGPDDKKPIYQRWWFITAGVLVVLMIIGSASGGEEPATADETAASAPAESKAKTKAEPAQETKQETKAEPAPEPEAMSVSAVEMLKEFEGNEAAADLKYQGKKLEVTGTAVKVDTEWLDDEQYVLQINGGGAWDILTVNCNDVSASEAAQVKVDSQISVIGTFDDGGDLGVELKDCSLA